MIYPMTLEELCVHPAYIGRDRPHGSTIKKLECWKWPWFCTTINSIARSGIAA